VRAVNAAFPEVVFANWDRCELCLPQAQVCAQLIEQYHLSFPEAAHLLHSAGRYLRDRGQYAQAEPLLQRALTIGEQVLGPEHSEIATTLETLEELYVKWGKYQQAEPLLQRALALREQALGANHPDVAESLNNLAWLYGLLGKYAEAEPLYHCAHVAEKTLPQGRGITGVM
jgi:tetratricopeptide (TPR) repeat protein